jgi:sterol desaturase/sphingolipid hydroxylase (fatty acid hydroxylase superfamily)
MLTEIHSEFDAPWSMHNLFPSIFGGALRHRYHHAYTQKGFQGTKGVHYHEFLKVLDDVCGYAVSDEDCRRVRFDERVENEDITEGTEGRRQKKSTTRERQLAASAKCE